MLSALHVSIHYTYLLSYTPDKVRGRCSVLFFWILFAGQEEKVSTIMQSSEYVTTMRSSVCTCEWAYVYADAYRDLYTHKGDFVCTIPYRLAFIFSSDNFFLVYFTILSFRFWFHSFVSCVLHGL
jgi:hypothetical protein